MSSARRAVPVKIAMSSPALSPLKCRATRGRSTTWLIRFALGRVVSQDRVIVLEQEPDRVRLWGAVRADRGEPDDLFFA
jgi:hypothetical protein